MEFEPSCGCFYPRTLRLISLSSLSSAAGVTLINDTAQPRFLWMIRLLPSSALQFCHWCTLKNSNYHPGSPQAVPRLRHGLTGPHPQLLRAGGAPQLRPGRTRVQGNQYFSMLRENFYYWMRIFVSFCGVHRDLFPKVVKTRTVVL